MQAASRLKRESALCTHVYGLSAPHKSKFLGERVRIVGLTVRRELNGAHGSVQSIDPGSARLLVLLEGTGEGVPVRRANLQLAPPAPVATQYNVGTGQYTLPSYLNNGQPRRCRAGGGGGPSYSTRHRPAQAGDQVPAPQAGALLPRPNEPILFRTALRDGTLPARGGGSDGEQLLRWVDPLSGQTVATEQVDAGRWLPIFIDGLRETQNPAVAYVALQGAVELASAAARCGMLLAALPNVAQPLRSALATRENTVICATLECLQHLLRVDKLAGRALQPHYR